MLHRSLFVFTLAAVMTANSQHAQAGSAWLPSGTMAPIEQRVAVASGSDRSTLWTSLRFEAAAGPVGVVIPVPPGAFLDHSSDAWLEALEVATAPRVLPPDGVTFQCPGQDPSSEHPFHVAGRIDHQQSLLPDELLVLADVAAVKAWATQQAFVVSPEVSAALDAMSGMQFVVERFSASGGEAVTPTLRVVMPGVAPALPLTLTQASDKDLLVTTWLLGTGRGELTGTALATLSPPALKWNAGGEDTNYFDARREALLAAGSGSALLESSNHEAISHNLAIAGGTASVDGVIKTFFERAAAYGDGDPATACVAQAAAALASTAPVGLGCPRADLGVVGGTATCTESPMPGQIDPDVLRCGPGADDLAVALSGLSGSAAWLSRWSMIIGPHATGAAWPVTFAPGPEVDVVLSAQNVDLGDCTDAGADAGQTSSSSSTSASSSASSGSYSSAATTGAGMGAGSFTTGAGYGYDPVPPPDIGCGCSGTADTSDWGAGGTDSSGAGAGDTGDDSGNDYSDDCSSDTSSGSGDDCSGDTTGETSSGDDCEGGDTTGSSGDDCDTSSDPGGADSCDGGDSYGGDDCAGDASSGDSCSGGSSGGDMSCDGGSSSGDCAIASPRISKPNKKRMPRLSAMTLGALALLLPLRRARRPRREPKNAPGRRS